MKRKWKKSKVIRKCAKWSNKNELFCQFGWNWNNVKRIHDNGFDGKLFTRKCHFRFCLVCFVFQELLVFFPFVCLLWADHFLVQHRLLTFAAIVGEESGQRWRHRCRNPGWNERGGVLKNVEEGGGSRYGHSSWEMENGKLWVSVWRLGPVVARPIGPVGFGSMGIWSSRRGRRRRQWLKAQRCIPWRWCSQPRRYSCTQGRRRCIGSGLGPERWF